MRHTDIQGREEKRLALLKQSYLAGCRFDGEVVFACTDTELYVNISTWSFDDDDYQELRANGFRSALLSELGRMAEEREVLDGLENRGGCLKIKDGFLGLEWMSSNAALMIRDKTWEKKNNAGSV